MRDTYGTNVSTIWREQLAQHRSHRFKRLRCRTGYGFPATAVPEQRQRGPLPVSRRLVVTKGINNGRQLQRVLREMQGQTRLRRGYRGNQRAPDGQGNLPGLRHQDEPDPGQSLTSLPGCGRSDADARAPAVGHTWPGTGSDPPRTLPVTVMSAGLRGDPAGAGST